MATDASPPLTVRLLSVVLSTGMLASCASGGPTNPTPQTKPVESTSVEPSAVASEAADSAVSVRWFAQPLAGAVRRRGVLMIHRALVRPAEGRPSPSAGFRLYAKSGRLLEQSLLAPKVPLPSESEFHVSPYSGGFVVSSIGRAWRVSPNGVVTDLRLVREPVALKRGDVFAPIGQAAWVFRPGTSWLLRPQAPPGAKITHADGQGRLWALGRPEAGQAVVFSAVPGESWSKQLVGTFSDTKQGCACDTWPGPSGRGPAIVVAGNPLQHVSTDYGRTWTTYDVGDSAPYRAVLGDARFPVVSVLPDGRLVIGYFEYWVANDPTNTSFIKLSRSGSDRALASSAGGGLAFRDHAVSPDGGKTWIPVVEIPNESLTSDSLSRLGE